MTDAYPAFGGADDPSYPVRVTRGAAAAEVRPREGLPAPPDRGTWFGRVLLWLRDRLGRGGQHAPGPLDRDRQRRPRPPEPAAGHMGLQRVLHPSDRMGVFGRAGSPAVL